MISMLSSANARPKTIGDVRAVIRPHGQREDESARLFRPRGGLEARATEDMFFGAPHTRPGRTTVNSRCACLLAPSSSPPLLFAGHANTDCVGQEGRFFSAPKVGALAEFARNRAFVLNLNEIDPRFFDKLGQMFHSRGAQIMVWTENYE